MTLEILKDSRLVLVIVVYLSVFLDNVLLTVVGERESYNALILNFEIVNSNLMKKIILLTTVPIIPDYLCTISENSTYREEDENGKIGLLLSSKAFVQLILNPAVGTFTSSVGYAKPLFLGNVCLLLAALRMYP